MFPASFYSLYYSFYISLLLDMHVSRDLSFFSLLFYLFKFLPSTSVSIAPLEKVLFVCLFGFALLCFSVKLFFFTFPEPSLFYSSYFEGGKEDIHTHLRGRGSVRLVGWLIGFVDACMGHARGFWCSFLFYFLFFSVSVVFKSSFV